MNFLRRILGLSANSSPSAIDDGIVVTREEETQISPPPEPVIELPETDDVSATPQASEQAASDANPHTAVTTPPSVLQTRPLPPLETVTALPGQRIMFGQLSDVGMVRGNNQDSMLSVLSSGMSTDELPDFGLFIVADGMGGHQEGERASAITVRTLARHVMNELFGALLEQRMNDPDQPSIAEVLREAVQEANDAVTEQIPEGGTTLTACVIIGDLAYIAHVGDSRAYMITDDGIEQITRDHSLVQRLIELDQLTPEEAAEHPQRNVLYRAIGQSETLDVDAITRRLPPRSRLLLCSDGLWNLVSEDAIVEVLNAHRDPQDACHELVQLANDRGGPDNITVIIVQIPG